MNMDLLLESLSPVNNMETFSDALNSCQLKDIEYEDGNQEVEDVLTGMKKTKELREKKYCLTSELEEWIELTSARYKRYTNFTTNSNIPKKYLKINKLIKHINRNFKQNYVSSFTINLVYTADKELIYLFRKWDLFK